MTSKMANCCGGVTFVNALLPGSGKVICFIVQTT